MSGSERFVLYVKAGSNGVSFGDCPFSQRVFMYATLKIPGKFWYVTVDCSNKPDSFLKVNPDGKVPVLVDKTKNKTITDSGDITAYIDHEFPEPDLQQNYSGPGQQAVSDLFGKFATFFTNKDESASEKLRSDVIDELRKIDSFLLSSNHKGKFMLSDTLCEIDCAVLPKLRHVQVAGSMKDFKIPEELAALRTYIKHGEAHYIFKLTCPPDVEIQRGWTRHL